LSSARSEAASIGAGSRVLAYALVGPEAAIGQNCMLHEHVVLLGAITLEDDVRVHSGAQLLGRVRVEQGASVGAGAVLGSDLDGGGPTGEIVVRRFASVGPNVTVLPGVVIGRRAVVEAGSVVTQSVPANAIVTGNPATIVSYVDSGQDQAARDLIVPAETAADMTATKVRTVTLHRLTWARDLRGSLMAAEFAGLPFPPRRIFTVYDVPSESVRGAHAHRVCSQFLICLAGGLSCLVDDGSAREEVRLASPDLGLHIPPMIWGTQWRYSRDAVLLVLASHPYDAADYIRDYEEFLQELEPGGQ
jgi:acetyltransferase-like isoleucine patch superfamily enzyme